MNSPTQQQELQLQSVAEITTPTRNQILLVGVMAVVGIMLGIYVVYSISQLQSQVTTLSDTNNTAITNLKASVNALTTKSAYITYDATGNATFAKNVTIAGSVSVGTWNSLLVTKVKNLALEQTTYSPITSGFIYAHNFIVWNIGDSTTVVTGSATASQYANTVDPVHVILPMAGVWSIRAVLSFYGLSDNTTQLECYLAKNATHNAILDNSSILALANITGTYEVTLTTTQHFDAGDYIATAFYCNNANQTSAVMGERSTFYAVRES